MPPEITEEPGEDIRSALEAAATAVEEAAKAPEGETPPAGTPPTDEPTGETPPAGTEPATGEVPAKKETPPAGEVPPAGEAAAPPPPAPDKDDRAPGTWNPAAREAWKDIPKEVKAEIWKRERDTSRALTASMKARQFEQEFSQVMQPYMGFIAAEGSNPLQAVNFMMRTGAILRVGTDEQKAQTVADVIKTYKINLELLDSLVAGETPQTNPQIVTQQLIRQELAPFIQMVQQARQGEAQREAQTEQEIAEELDKFTKEHEFYWDVRDEMMVHMEVASRLGRPISLTQAYERAIMESEPVRRVIEARKARKTALEATQRANDARRSATSVSPSSNTGTVTPAKGGSLRDDIVAAIDAQPGR